jgi:hypothetical protein
VVQSQEGEKLVTWVLLPPHQSARRSVGFAALKDGFCTSSNTRRRLPLLSRRPLPSTHLPLPPRPPHLPPRRLLLAQIPQKGTSRSSYSTASRALSFRQDFSILQGELHALAFELQRALADHVVALVQVLYGAAPPTHTSIKENEAVVKARWEEATAPVAGEKGDLKLEQDSSAAVRRGASLQLLYAR